MASILLVLALSANTGFADFPRLCHAVAIDRYLPFSFILRGRRLVYTYGIYALATLTAILLILFKGVTDRLIPLYAIGAFTAFTMSQAGMVVHWTKNRSKGWHWKICLNGLGAVATGITAIVVLVAKFTSGAWITALLIALIIALMLAVHHHYAYVQRATRDCDPLNTADCGSPAVIVPVGGWSTITANAIEFAMAISDEVYAVHIKTEEHESTNAVEQWHKFVSEPAKKAGHKPPEFVVLDSPFRLVVRPLLDYVTAYQEKNPDRRVAVLLPELVETHWIYYFLHNQRAAALKALLYVRGNHRIAVINVPWYLESKRRNPNQEPPLDKESVVPGIKIEGRGIQSDKSEEKKQ
jgi:hypothetical protein